MKARVKNGLMVLGISLFCLPSMLYSQLVDCATAINCNQQNLSCGQLIRNNSFELYGQISNTCDGNIEDACCWLKLPGHQGTSDLMNTAFPDVSCSGGTYTLDLSPATSSGLVEAVPPSGPFGSSQNGYAGFFTLDKRTLTAGIYREYICQQLSAPIANGQTANISFQVTLSDFSNQATQFQISFVNDLYSGITYAGVNGNITSLTPSNYTTVGPFTNATGWTTVNTTWTNTTGGPVNYVIIGNVLDFTPTMTSSVAVTPVTALPSGTQYQGYYGIDNFSIEKTQSCCSGKDATFIAYNTGTPASDDILMSSIYSTISSPLVNNIYIQGELVINGNYSLTNKNITFGAGSKVTVQPGKTFTITGSHLHGCDQMWEGVYLNNIGAVFTATNSIIEDAINGVFVNNTTTVNATGTLFRNDLVGINYTNCTSTTNNTILGCTFKSTVNNTLPVGGSNPGYLLPPYAGKHGKCGIMLNNTPSVSFKPVLATDKNYFQVLNFGVVANNSGTEISNAEFASIYNYDNFDSTLTLLENGVAIRAINTSTTTLRTLKVSDVSGQVKISSCDNGILAKGRLQTNLSKNLVQNVKYRAISHVQIPTITTSPNFQISVTENTIKNAYEGIMFYQCGKTRSNTSKNILQNLQEQSGSRGIIVEESTIGATALCASDATQLPIQITDNNLTKWVIGISTSNATCMNINANTILLSSPSNAQHHGIWMNKSPYNVVTTNNVYGNYKDWQCTGVRIWQSPGVQVGCNKIDNNGISFFLDNDCSSSQFGSNYLSNYSKGFLLVSSAKLGPQTTLGTNYSLKNTFDKTANSLYEFVADQSVIGNNSIFYFWPEPGITTMDIDTLQGAVINGSGTILATSCTYFSYPNGGFSSAINNQLKLSNSAIGTTSIGYNGCGQLFIGGEGIASGMIQNFSNGYYQNVAFSQEDIFREEHEWMFNANTWASYQLLTNDQKESLQPQIRETMELISENEIALFYRVESLIDHSSWEEAASLNSSIVPQTSYATKLQETNDILISEWQKLSNAVSYSGPGEDVKEKLFETANLCLTEYGDAVLKARIYLHQYVDPTLQFTDACEVVYTSKSSVLDPEKNNTENAVSYFVYPNPTNSSIHIETNVSNSVYYYITDMLGKKTAEGNFFGKTQLNVENWQGGVYFITINQERTIRVIVQ